MAKSKETDSKPAAEQKAAEPHVVTPGQGKASKPGANKKAMFILIALLFLGAVGFFLNKSSNNTNNKQQAAAEAAKPDAVKYVQSFYDEYIDSDDPAENIFKKFGTDNFVNSTRNDQGRDPVLCSAQDRTQATINVTRDKEHVIAQVSYPSVQQYDVLLTVVNKNGKLKIDTVTCPTPNT